MDNNISEGVALDSSSIAVEFRNFDYKANMTAFRNLYISFYNYNGTRTFHASGQLFCHSEDSKFLVSFLGPIAFLPQTIAWIRLLVAVSGTGAGEYDKIQTIMTFYTYAVWYVAYCMQSFFAQPRPYPMCSASWFSEYGFPCPEVVYLSSIATLSLCGSTFMRKQRQGLSMINILWMITFWFIYPLAHYLTYLSTTGQLLFSMVIGSMSTFFVCMLVNVLDVNSFLNYLLKGIRDINTVVRVSRNGISERMRNKGERVEKREEEDKI